MATQILTLEKEKYFYLPYSFLAKCSKTNFKRLYASSNYFAFYFCAFLTFLGTALSSQTLTFNYTGNAQTVSLPAGNYEIECWGADGGEVTANTALPGNGGYSNGTITLSSPTTFTIYVGGKGNGGAQPLGGFNSGNTTTKTNITTATGGGGATDIRVLVDDYFHRIIVAGGGGGQGTTTGTGGHGGGLVGQNGQGTVTNTGVGGTQTVPGVYPGGSDAKPATFGEGGDGPAGTTGGQGGGGWYGGSFGTRTNGGGAGGSGYVLTSSSFKPTGYFSAHSNYYFNNAITLRSDEGGFVPNPVISGNGHVVITSLTRSPNDAGVKSLVGITDTTCAGSYTAVAMVRNYGNNQINSITVGWSINGIPQANKVSTTMIDTFNGTGPDTLAITLDTFSFSSATDVKVWTTLPNGQTDPANGNDTLEISIGNPVNVTTGVISELSCYGAENGILNSPVSGGKGPYSRMWSNGETSASLTLLAAGTYTVVVTDAYGCQDSSTIELTQPDSIAITAMITNESSLGNDGAIDVSVTGGTPGYTYDWDNSATTQDISGLTAGTYTVIVSDTNFCIDTMEFVVTSTVGINNSSEEFSFEVYPNPSTNGEFTVSVPNASNELVIEVTDLLGKRVFYMENAPSQTRLSLNEHNGLYFVKIIDGTKTNTKRLNIER